MKKVLNILSNITLSTIITTNIIACQQPKTNNQNNKPIEPQFIPQQPPKNSNWKLVNKKDYSNEIKIVNNKWYFGIFPKMWSLYKPVKPYNIFKAINNGLDISIYGKFGDGFKTSNDNVYRWDGDSEPILPKIDKNTGEIIDWNEKIESE